MVNKIVAYRISIDNADSVNSYRELIKLNKDLKKEILDSTDTDTKRFKDLKQAYAENRKEIVSFRRELNNSKPIAERFTEGLINSFKQVGITIAAAFAIDNIRRFVDDTLQFVGEFEQGFARINTVAQLSQNELQALQSQALQTASGTTVNLEEIPNTLFNIISATGDATTANNKLSDSILASEAGFADLEATASAGVNIFNAIGDETKELNDIFDVLFVTQKEGVLTFDDLSATIPELIGVGQHTGFAFENVASLFATLTRTGQTVASSRTQLAGFFNIFNNTSKLEKFNKVLKEGTGKTVFDAKGNLRDITEIVQDFNTVLGKASSDAERTKIFGALQLDQEAAKGLQNISNGVGILEEISEATANATQSVNTYGEAVGETAKQFELSETPARELQRIYTEQKIELFEIGERAAPAVTQAKITLAKIVLSLLQGFSKFTDFLRQNRGALIVFKDAALALSLVLGGVFINTIRRLPIVMQVFAAATKGVAATMTTLRNVFLTNPFGLIVTGVLLAVEALRFFNEQSKTVALTSQEIGDAINRLNEGFFEEKKTIDSLFSVLQDQNRADNERIAAVNELNRLYPEYISLSKDDLDNTEKLEKAYVSLNKAILDNLANQIIKDTLGDAGIQLQKLNEENRALVEGDKAPSYFNRVKGFLNEIAAIEISGIDIEVEANNEEIERITGNVDNLQGTIEKTVEQLSKFDLRSLFEKFKVKVEPEVTINPKDPQKVQKAYEDAYRAAIKNVDESRRSLLAEAQLEFLNSDKEAAAQRKLAEDLKNIKQNSAMRLQEIDVAYNKESTSSTNERLLEIEQLEQNFAKEIEKIDQGVVDKRNKAYKKLIDEQLTFYKNQQNSLSNALKIAALEVEKNANTLQQAGVDTVAVLQRKQLEITRQFQDESLQSNEQFLLSQAEIDFQSGDKRTKQIEEHEARKLAIQIEAQKARIQNAKNIEEAELQIAIDAAQRRVFASQQINQGVEDAAAELAQAESDLVRFLGTGTTEEIEALKAQLATLKSDFKDIGDEAGTSLVDSFRNQLNVLNIGDETQQLISEVAGLFSQAAGLIGQFGQLAAARFNAALSAIDERAEDVQENLDLIESEEDRLAGAIENATQTQINALERQQAALDARRRAEEQTLRDLEIEREQIREAQAESEKRLAIFQTIIAGAVQIAQSFSNPFLIPIIAAGTLAQLAIINATEYEQGDLVLPFDTSSLFASVQPTISHERGIHLPQNGGLAKGPLHSQGGIPFRVKGESVRREMEGGEFISSRKSTGLFLPVYDYLNNLGNKIGSNFSHSQIPTAKPYVSMRYQEGGEVNTSSSQDDQIMIDVLSSLNEISSKIGSAKVILSISEVRDNLNKLEQLETQADN